MTKIPFTGQSERANELLGLIHSDVCGPFSSTVRGGIQYFILENFELFKRFRFVFHSIDIAISTETICESNEVLEISSSS